jgi:phage repressor protein C with HTH and peptisase S24 domain
MQPQPYQRLAEVRKETGLSFENFGKPMDVSGTAVYNWEKGKTPISVMAAQSIEKVYGISKTWLMEGKGEKHLAALHDLGKRNEVFLKKLNDKAFAADINQVVVPILSARPSAGSGNLLEDYVGTIGGLRFEELWLRRTFTVPPENLCLLEVDGDSMSPTIMPNELIFVDASPSQDFLREGVWVLRIDDVLCVKRIKRIAPREYHATSDNPAYSPIALDETAQPMGRVLLKRFF